MVASFRRHLRAGDVSVRTIETYLEACMRRARENAPVPAARDLRRLLEACERSGFDERRDRALLMVFIDTGARLSDREPQVGGRRRARHRPRRQAHPGGWAPTVPAAGEQGRQVIDRYLRIRRSHAGADLPRLWLGRSGRITPSGIRQAARAPVGAGRDRQDRSAPSDDPQGNPSRRRHGAPIRLTRSRGDCR